MKKSYGNITNPFGVNSKLIPTTATNVPTTQGTVTTYNSASASSLIQTPTTTILAANLSNVIQIFNMINPGSFGNTVFKNVQTYPTIYLYMIGNQSEPDLPIPILPFTQIKYIDNGRAYELLGSRNEKRNYGWEPVSNDELYPYIERSDIDAFDFPQFSVRGTRKIPAYSADTLCGPILYSGETFDHLNFNWFFGNNAAITFNPIKVGNTPIPLSGSPLTSREGCASISTVDGKTLFYTNGETVFTSGNTIMSNGTGLSSSGTSTQSSLIVPQPNSNQYYIFTTDFNGAPNGFEYSMVNMDLQGGEGMITTKNIKLINSPVSEKVTGCDVGNEDAYWVITHTSGDTNYYVYKINSGGISPPILNSIGSTHNTARGYMKTSPDGKKLISLLYDEDIIDIFDFDNTGGTLNNLITLSGITYDIGPYGLEFSSDSTKFYVSEGAGEKIYQLDLSYSAATDIENNIITLPTISGASLGALQMGPDEKIYVADLNNTFLHVIHNPNGLGVQCNLQINDFALSSTTVSGGISQWGLPNVITTRALSCDRYVYVSNRNQIAFNFDLVINNVNNVIIPKNLDFTGEVYKYDYLQKQFTNSSLYTFNLDHQTISGDNTTMLSIPLTDIGEGEFIIKGYYGYDINTLVAKQLGYRRNSIDTYKRGELYGMYVPATDWYFLNIFEAEVPQFNNSTPSPATNIGNLVVASQFTTANQRIYYIDGLSDPIVAYNGGVLAKNIEYSAVTSGFTPYIELTFDPLENQMLTYAYVRNGKPNDIFADLYTVVEPVPSGATGTQLPTDRIFYNTTENRYEFYLLTPPQGDIFLSLNGSALAAEIEYVVSTTDNRRLIMLEDLVAGDILEAFYTPAAAVIGTIYNNNPTISWSIPTAPTNTYGKFIVQWTSPDDEEFENILYSFETPYVELQKAYSLQMLLTNANAGDKFLYRIKNEKFYNPIIGETIYTFAYSITVEVEISTNAGKSY